MTRFSDEHYSKIGQIVSIWSSTEHFVNFALGGLLQIDHHLARAITAPIINFYTRVDILETVAKQRVADDKLLAEFFDILSDIRSAYQQRNDVVHGIWHSVGDSAPLLVRIRKKHLPEVDIDPMPLDELDKKIIQIGLAQSRLIGILFDNGWRPPDLSPIDKPRGRHPHVTQKGGDANEK